MHKERKQALQEYKEGKKEHTLHHINHVKKMPDKIRQRLLRTEDQRRLARIAKAINGKLITNGVVRMEQEGREYQTKEDIERILLPVNKTKIQASEHTSFMQDPLLKDFGYRSNRQTHDDVLQGTYNISASCSSTTELLVRGLAKPL
jgi:hypothetical protein